MIHLTESDTTVFAAALFLKRPEVLEQAVESTETYLMVEITGLTMMLAERQRFVRMIERGAFREGDTEVLPLLEQYFRDKRMPTTFADWKPVFSFTSELPDPSAPKVEEIL